MKQTMKDKPKATLFVSTFNMPRHLSLVCAGIERQNTKDFEVIICDDGSGEETSRVVEDFRSCAAMQVDHVWQQHEGFRKCKILNEGLRRAKGEICIFLDGDCIPHRDFVKDHIDMHEPGKYLAGRRVELGPDISSRLTAEKVRNGFFDWPRLPLIISALRSDSEFLNRTIRITSPWLRSILKLQHVADMKGCNYSVTRSALEAINGFDETYEGYGREDTDIEIRLQNLGFSIKSMKGVALQFHVWHPRRVFTAANDARLEELKLSKRTRCLKGLHQAET
ncbi:MAG: glycosyltransferase [Bdellovibrionota bacterium]